MSDVDLRILILADTHTLPEDVQAAFDRFRIRRAQEAVIALLLKRHQDIPELVALLDRLESTLAEDQIVREMVRVAEGVEPFRARTGLHTDYVMLIISQQMNPWGVVDFQRDFDNPPPFVADAARKLWQLCKDHHVDVEAHLKLIRDPLLNAMNLHYITRPGKG